MTDLSLSELVAALAARKVSAEEADACVPGPHRPARRPAARVHHARRRRRAGPRAGARRRPRGRPPPGPAARRAARLQGPLPHARAADVVRHPTAEYFTAERECTAVARLRAGGRGDPRQAQHDGAGARPLRRQSPPRRRRTTRGAPATSPAARPAAPAPPWPPASPRARSARDTGGSIRLPAACCGIVGLKPTYGRVSRAGAMPLSWSLDHLGPMARTVADAALMLEIVAGHDPATRPSSRAPRP